MTVRERSTARIVLADEQDRVLLFLSYGKRHDVPPRWITPGGGLDAGEGFAEAAVRELREETGLEVDTVGEPFAHVDFAVDQRWHPYAIGHYRWFAVRTTRFEPDDAGYEPDERIDMVEHRWWAVDELEAEAPVFEPADLPDLIRRGLATLA